jgi:competence protein ComEA
MYPSEMITNNLRLGLESGNDAPFLTFKTLSINRHKGLKAMTNRLFTALALSTILATGSAFAQAQPAPAPTAPAAPVVPVKPATPAATAPAPAAATPAAKPAAAATTNNVVPMAKKVNLNTATDKELDNLPQIGAARSKAIIEARAKGKFKNWDDFVARNVVPKNDEDAIKDKVSF